MSSKTIKSLNELEQEAKQLSTKLAKKQIILLVGSMGSGKSQFVKFLLKALGGEGSSSPTFAIHNVYPLKSNHMDHIDLYRVEDDEDLESTGFWELFSQKEAVICIEWADRMDKSIYPKDWDIKQINIQKLKDSEHRSFQIQ